MPTSTELPNDVASLKQLVETMRSALTSHDLEIEHLKLMLAKLRRAQYGRSSEQLDELLPWNVVLSSTLSTRAAA